MECIVLDYARTSRLAHWVRDEMREIAPRLYFGQALPRGLPLFALQAVTAISTGSRNNNRGAARRTRATE